MDLTALLVASPLLVFLGLLVISTPQRRQVGASVGAWLATCAALAVIASVPLAAWQLLALSGREVPTGWLAQALIFSAILCSRMVAPLRAQAQLGGLARVESAVEERVRSIAARLGVTPPPARGVQTLGSLRAFAAVVSPMRPTLLVSDGILQRLSGSEVDAILAHELAHLRNRSLWQIPLVFSGSTAFALALMSVAPHERGTLQPFIIVGTFLGVLLPLYSVYSRPNERWCDLRAARAIGFRAAASALDKIHTALPLSDAGWRGRFAYAVATHPPRVSRLAHLQAHAPTDERTQLPEVERPELLRARILAWLAFLGWLSLLVWGVLLLGEGETTAGTVVLLCPALVQIGCLGAVVWPTVRRAGRLVPTRRRGRWWVWGGLLFFIASMFGTVPLFSLLRRLAGPDRALRAELFQVGRWAVSAAAIAGAVAIVAGFVLSFRQRRLMAHAAALLSNLDAQPLAALATRRGKADPALRYYAAVCSLVRGDRMAGIRALEELAKDPVRVPAALLTLSSVVRASDPPRSLALAQRLSARLPTEPMRHLSLGLALRANGRLAEADEEARRLEQVRGQIGAMALALRARLALDRGQPARAAELLAAAMRAAPREPYALVVQAHLTRLTGSAEETARALAEARAAVEQNPLLLLGDELQELERDPASTASG